MDITDNAILAMEEMHDAGIPVEKFETSDEGFDFFFSRGLEESEQQKAQTIAQKYLPTLYTWHDDKPVQTVGQPKRKK